MSPQVAIIDYGVGNLLNVANACHYLGAKIKVVRHGDELDENDLIIIPGVGASHEGMRGLENSHFVEAIQEQAKKGTSILGICLGMQLLASSSDEGGKHKTLNLISGKVKEIPRKNTEGQSVCIPNINWLPLQVKNTQHGMSDLLNHHDFYFVHAYRFEVDNDNNIIANACHQGVDVAAVIQHENIMGCQFHPEKSSYAGLSLLRYFLK